MKVTPELEKGRPVEWFAMTFVLLGCVALTIYLLPVWGLLTGYFVLLALIFTVEAVVDRTSHRPARILNTRANNDKGSNR
jgi:hypothetical protein